MGHSIGNTLGNSIGSAVGSNLGQQSAYGPYQQGLANAYAAQQAQAFRPAKWVLNGVHYNNVADFATAVFGDTPARTMFLLKYEEK